MDRLHAVSQHMLNMCKRFNDEYLIKGISHLYSKIYYYDYWNILYQKLPNSAKRK